MKKYLWVMLSLFGILFIFYLTQINYNEPLFSEDNKPYTYSSMITFIGLLIGFILIQLKKLGQAD